MTELEPAGPPTVHHHTALTNNHTTALPLHALSTKAVPISEHRLCLDFSLGAQFWTSELCCW
jgi:hypothetical protein